jgi:signal transduction histidine kinase
VIASACGTSTSARAPETSNLQADRVFAPHTLGAVLLSGVAMFHMGADVVILAVAAASSTVAHAAAFLVGRSITAPVDRLRSISSALARGELSARAPEDRPAEIAELGAAFNVMATRLEELFDARRELVAWATHDLRTPLAAIRAMSEAIEDGVATPEQYVQALGEQARTLSTLVDDLFELARIDAGALTLDPARRFARGSRRFVHPWPRGGGGTPKREARVLAEWRPSC